MPDFVGNILTPLASAAFGAVIASYLALWRFRAQKWWEKKAEAYERVIDALHHMKQYADTHLQADMRGRELSEEQEQDLLEVSRRSRAEVERAIDVGSLLLCDKAVERLRLYKQDSRDRKDVQSWLDAVLADLEATTTCLDDFLRIAKQDLKRR